MTEPLHVNSDPRDGWYWLFGKPRDPDKPLASRPRIPVRIWTHEVRDEAGDLIDDVTQWVQIGDEVRRLYQDEWLFMAKREITEDEYTAMFVMGDWK